MKPVYFQGLKKRPLFDEIVGYLETQQQMMKYPDRTATRIKDSHYFTNLDGQGGMSLADQAEKIQKERLMQEMRRQSMPSMSGSNTPQSFVSANIPYRNMINDLVRESQMQFYTPLGMRSPQHFDISSTPSGMMTPQSHLTGEEFNEEDRSLTLQGMVDDLDAESQRQLEERRRMIQEAMLEQDQWS